MLKDQVRTRTYQRAILQNPHLFEARQFTNHPDLRLTDSKSCKN